MKGKIKRGIKRRMLVVLAAVGLSGVLAGCTPDSSEGSTKEIQKTEAREGQELKEDLMAGTDAEQNDGEASGEDEERKEVSREDFPDCDGSGHGYVEIHYSDGSVEIEEY